MVLLLEERVGVCVKESKDGPQRECKANNEISNYEQPKLFVERYLEEPIYKGDPQMLTVPTACTFRGIPLLDDW